jgi:hypothetical protein
VQLAVSIDEAPAVIEDGAADRLHTGFAKTVVV